MNIGVALALNYSKEDILPFFNSFEKNADGTLFVITDNLNLVYGSDFKKIKLINISEFINRFNISISRFTVFNLKPVLFYLFLKHYVNRETAEKILLTDTDLIFQYDPFSLTEKVNTNTFLICEEKLTYKDCPTNTTWYNAGYAESYDIVKNKKILNCGVTVGWYTPVLDYQKKVAIELQHILNTRPYFAYDQVILNVLTYVEKTITPTIIEHGNQYIVHMHQMDSAEITSDIFKYDVICSKDSTPYCIVHQYNEKPEATAFVNKNWRY